MSGMVQFWPSRIGMNRPALQNQRTGKIELYSDETIDSRFYGLYLASVEGKLVELSKGMGVQNISGQDIKKLP